MSFIPEKKTCQLPVSDDCVYKNIVGAFITMKNDKLKEDIAKLEEQAEEDKKSLLNDFEFLWSSAQKICEQMEVDNSKEFVCKIPMPLINLNVREDTQGFLSVDKLKELYPGFGTAVEFFMQVLTDKGWSPQCIYYKGTSIFNSNISIICSFQ